LKTKQDIQNYQEQLSKIMSNGNEVLIFDNALSQITILQKYMEGLNQSSLVLKSLETIAAAKHGQILETLSGIDISSLYSKLDPSHLKWQTKRKFEEYCRSSRRWFKLVQLFGSNICFLQDSKGFHYFRRMRYFNEDSFASLLF
jgi:hypothetical protein